MSIRLTANLITEIKRAAWRHTRPHQSPAIAADICESLGIVYADLSAGQRDKVTAAVDDATTNCHCNSPLVFCGVPGVDAEAILTCDGCLDIAEDCECEGPPAGLLIGDIRIYNDGEPLTAAETLQALHDEIRAVWA